ncbi:MAG: hypothetical protein GWN85_24575, partial [Gemmatimonadetes bacterium]|nr:hypothetical protein [Gemmatimonadota bacterium]NIR36045.1 hypothetical protein [Actinomycetota bacterium]NIS30304.1 hypothetical protein [Actinomycetota bacterium]NIU65531.1 hypothetical protein [Actinomycetota bacterium]NIW27348.1 hypothetical protein [Actinomycetota bacterium]
SLEPHCFDAEGSATILAIHLRRAELRAKGATDQEIDAEIAREIDRGALRLPTRPVLSYMMSSAQVLYNNVRASGSGAGSPMS